MYNQQDFGRVAVRSRTIPQSRVSRRIDLKMLFYQIMQDLFAHSTLTFDGSTQTVQYGYSGHGRCFTFNSSPVYPPTEYEDYPFS